jgi:hypothetical protein
MKVEIRSVGHLERITFPRKSKKEELSLRIAKRFIKNAWKAILRSRGGRTAMIT